jgi:1-acyl-sn-glycerol-3-phosphate acyltransferase
MLADWAVLDGPGWSARDAGAVLVERNRGQVKRILASELEEAVKCRSESGRVIRIYRSPSGSTIPSPEDLVTRVV